MKNNKLKNVLFEAVYNAFYSLNESISQNDFYTVVRFVVDNIQDNKDSMKNYLLKYRELCAPSNDYTIDELVSKVRMQIMCIQDCLEEIRDFSFYMDDIDEDLNITKDEYNKILYALKELFYKNDNESGYQAVRFINADIDEFKNEIIPMYKEGEAPRRVIVRIKRLFSEITKDVNNLNNCGFTNNQIEELYVSLNNEL